MGRTEGTEGREKVMSVKLVFRDLESNTLYEQELSSGEMPLIPAQGDFVQLPEEREIEVKSRRFIYPDSEHGQTDVQLILVCKKLEKPTGGNVKTSGS
jgi:hypothetical protein